MKILNTNLQYIVGGMLNNTDVNDDDMTDVAKKKGKVGATESEGFGLLVGFGGFLLCLGVVAAVRRWCPGVVRKCGRERQELAQVAPVAAAAAAA